MDIQDILRIVMPYVGEGKDKILEAFRDRGVVVCDTGFVTLKNERLSQCWDCSVCECGCKGAPRCCGNDSYGAYNG